MTRSSKRAAAMAEVSRWSTVVGDRALELDAARDELVAAEESIGEATLEEPGRAGAIVGGLQKLRDRITVAERALAAAGPKLDGARVRVLEVDAAQHDAEADRLRKDLCAHEARTAELLAQLEKHECVFVPERQWARAALEAGRGPASWSVPRSDRLRDLVGQEEARAGVVRDVAAGVDPAIRLAELADPIDSTVHGLDKLELYPPSVWGPAAVIAAPAFLDQVAHVRRRLVEHDAQLEVDDSEEIAKRQEVITRLDEQEAQFVATRNSRWALSPQDQERRAARRAWIADREAWRRDAPKRREEILAELEALIGETVEV